MINEIISAICKAIHLEFGDSYEIYKEDVKQGLTEPCFLVYCINPNITQFMGNRYKTTNIFNILYFPSTDSIENECNDVRERLFDCLEYITATGNVKFRGTKMNAQITDSVLNFNINYDFFINKSTESDPMEVLETDVGGVS